MAEKIPDDIRADLEKVEGLHQRATSDYSQCLEFNKLMTDILGRLEDAGCYRTADRVMSILLNCAPKEGSSCEKTTIVGEQVKKIVPNPDKPEKKDKYLNISPLVVIFVFFIPVKRVLN